MYSVHGGTDIFKEPQYDFSSNANFLGPPAHVRAALCDTDPRYYPDPSYTAVRNALGRHHDVDPKRIAVGAGASELIFRIARRYRRIITLRASFSEYARAALVTKTELVSVTSPEALIDASHGGGVCFLGQPNNPTGELLDEATIDAIASHAQVVLDLAYAPLVRGIVPVHPKAILLYSPNKTFNLTGLRAAYAILPSADDAFADEASAWVLDAYGCTFLTESAHNVSLKWVQDVLPPLHAARQYLAAMFASFGVSVVESPVSFLIARVGDAARVTTMLRERSIRVRDCTSFGMPNYIRLSAQSDEACRELIRHMKEIAYG